jgi:hypothetical protein
MADTNTGTVSSWIKATGATMMTVPFTAAYARPTKPGNIKRARSE